MTLIRVQGLHTERAFWLMRPSEDACENSA
jgi:hypothetical protein